MTTKKTVDVCVTLVYRGVPESAVGLIGELASQLGKMILVGSRAESGCCEVGTLSADDADKLMTDIRSRADKGVTEPMGPDCDCAACQAGRALTDLIGPPGEIPDSKAN